MNRLSTDQLGPAVGTIMSQQVRPVLRDYFNQDVAPTITEILKESAANALKVPTRPDVSPDVVVNANNVVKGATLGMRDTAVDMGLLTAQGSMTLGTRAFLGALGAVLILTGLASVALLIVLTMTALKLRREAKEHIC